MKSKILDAIGLSSAVLCLIHCVFFPLLMILPFGWSHNPYIDLFFLLVGVAVVWRVTQKVHSIRLKSLFWASIILISISIFSDLIYEVHLPLIYIGALGLISAHIINFRTHQH